jgi:hypothetical protein
MEGRMPSCKDATFVSVQGFAMLDKVAKWGRLVCVSRQHLRSLPRGGNDNVRIELLNFLPTANDA